MKNKNKMFTSVSVVIPMRNAATTVLETLRTISMQKYPIDEIIVVDNVSSDSSCKIVAGFSKKSKIPITLIRRKKDLAVASSFNLGVRRAKSDLVIFLTSDALLPTEKELIKLTRPLLKNNAVVASYPSALLPYSVWKTYNFWQKFHSARDVGVDNSTFALKFDCVRRKVFLKVGGFDEVNFGGDSAIGGEDLDLLIRLKKAGKVVKSRAVAYHLHYRGSDYSLKHMIKSHKMSSRSYGRYLRKSPLANIRTSIEFTSRPFLAILPFVPKAHFIGIILLIFYSFYYTRKMFFIPSIRSSPRIFLVPIVNIFFLYYDLYWLLQAFFTYQRRSEARTAKKKYSV